MFALSEITTVTLPFAGVVIGTVMVTVVPFTSTLVVGILLTVIEEVRIEEGIVVPMGKMIFILSIPAKSSPLVPVVKVIVYLLTCPALVEESTTSGFEMVEEVTVKVKFTGVESVIV